MRDFIVLCLTVVPSSPCPQISVKKESEVRKKEEVGLGLGLRQLNIALENWVLFWLCHWNFFVCVRSLVSHSNLIFPKWLLIVCAGFVLFCFLWFFLRLWIWFATIVATLCCSQRLSTVLWMPKIYVSGERNWKFS